MILPITLTAAAAAAFINIWLAIRVGGVRQSEKVMVGDGGNDRVIAAMRAQANFVEYTPFMLILLAAIELARGPSIVLWVVAGAYIIGRVIHGLGMTGLTGGRPVGIIITFLTLLGLGFYALYIPYSSTGQIAPAEVVPAG